MLLTGYAKQVPPLILNGVPLERVETFKYLGLLLSSDLSWSNHVDSVCSRAKRILGLQYRQYYHHADSEAIRQLYISLVRPHLEYGSMVWILTHTKTKRPFERSRSLPAEWQQNAGMLDMTSCLTY